jgi:hypothetical protein
MRGLSLCLPLLLVCASPRVAGQSVTITVRHNSEKELQTKRRLETLLAQYELTKWIFTPSVVIDEEEATPHSHPVLTLNTKGLARDPISLLSSFIHEQMHWFAEARGTETAEAIADLKAAFPDAPGGPPEGASDRESTYLHLVVCYLEYDALRQLVGEPKAREVINTSAQHFYKWIYRSVLTDGSRISGILEKHRLSI